MRLTAYAPGTTTKLGYLPEPLSVQASWAHDDVGALRVEYPSDALGGGILARGLHEGLDVAVAVPSGTGWSSPRSSRFLLLARDRDLTDATGVVSLTLPSYGWLLRKARNNETANLLPADHTQAGKRPFYSATPGTIMGTLLAENAARGGIPLSVDFTSTHDSLGNPWAKVATLYYELGVELSTVLDSLSAQGLCDWWTEGTTLRMVNADAGATDRSASVFLHLGKDVTDAPSSESLEELATRLLVRMEDGKTLTRTASGGPAPWGTWEGFMSQGGVNTDATAILMADAELARVGRMRGQYTRAITLDSAPMVAWQPGDWVTAPTYGTTREKVRAQQVTMTLGADGVQASAILNDRVLDAELRRAKRLNGITGGASPGGTGRPAPTPERDRRQPAAPTGLVVQSDAVLVQGVAQGMVLATWGQVTTATDSTVQEIDRYELWGRVNVAGSPWRRVATTEELSTEATWFECGTTWLFKVRAVARYSPVAGAWSATKTVLIASDVTPPSVPSAPTLRTKLGVILVDWNGLTALGGTMEPDFVRAEVGMATSSGGALTVTDSLEAKGTAAVAGQPYGQKRWFALRSVDRSGNVSAWSTRASIATTALVDVEAIIQRIDEAAIEIDETGQTLAEKLALIRAAADQAKRTTSTSTPTGSALVGWTWWRVDGTGKVIGEWEQTASPSGSTWVSRPIRSEAIANLDVGKLTASLSLLDEAVIEKLWAEVVRAKKITTDMLLVGRGVNLIPDPYLTNDAENARRTAQDGWSVITSSSGLRVLRAADTGAANNYAMLAADYLEVEAGDVYVLTWEQGGVSASNTPSLQATLKYLYADGTSEYVLWPGSSARTFADPTWQRQEESVTIPANVVGLRPSIRMNAGHVGIVYIRSPFFARKNDASLIVDGSILARHIKALQIEADHIKANAITADKIEAGALDAELITGGNIRTSATNPRNLINQYGVSAYDSDGTLQARLGNMTSRAGYWGVEVRDPNTGIMAPLASTLYGTKGYVAVDTAGSVLIGQPTDTDWDTITGYVDVVLPTGRARVEVSALLQYGDDTSSLCKGGNYWVGCMITQGSTEIRPPSTFYAAQEKFPASGVLGLRMIGAAWVVELDASATAYRFQLARRAQTWAGTGNRIDASLLARFITVTPL